MSSERARALREAGDTFDRAEAAKGSSAIN